MIEDICEKIHRYRFSQRPVVVGPLHAFNDDPFKPGSNLINPYLGGGVSIDFEKTTPNTVILKENLGYGLQNVYSHHNNGIGRIDPLCEKKHEDILYDPFKSPLSLPAPGKLGYEMPDMLLPGPNAFIPGGISERQTTLFDDWKR